MSGRTTVTTEDGGKYAGYPQVPTNHLRTALLSVGIILIIILAALAFHSPYVPVVTIQSLAKDNPVAFVTTAEAELSGSSDTAQYGPPYTFDAAQVYVIQPLQAYYATNTALDHSGLDQYLAASDDQKAAWNKAYTDALSNAAAVNGQVQVAAGTYGPVPALLEQLREIAAQGWLETSPNDMSTGNLLFLGDSGVLEDMAKDHNMLDVQWGMIHEEQAHYLGAWWLTPVSAMYNTFLKNDDNADLHAGVILGVVVLIGLAWPFIPGLNTLPKRLGVYRLIWRDYYLDR